MMFYKLEGPALEAYIQMIGELKAIAKDQTGLADSELVVRSLRPEDLGVANSGSTFNVSTANSFTSGTIINAQSIANNRFVGINGILIGESGTSVVAQIRIDRAGQAKRFWQIQDINFTQDQSVFFTDPVIIEQNQPITVSVYGNATDAEWRAVFYGAVVEKRGLLTA